MTSNLIVKSKILILIASVLFMLTPVLSEENKDVYLRVTRDSSKNPISLDTVIATYSKDDISVDLISALHVGEEEYYQDLNQLFTNYDALLFELIAPENPDFTKRSGGSSDSFLSILQNTLKSALELEFQLEGIDYTKSNFVHADMTPEAFAKSMKDRGESIWSIFIKLMLKSSELQQDNPTISTEFLLMKLLLDPNRAMSLRSILAEQFENMDVITEILDGPEGSTIISERNKVALEVLKKQMALGKKKFGIFYGAGHMPDMARRLIKDFNMSKVGERWLVAWKLS